jgi:hypothetical protein
VRTIRRIGGPGAPAAATTGPAAATTALALPELRCSRVPGPGRTTGPGNPGPVADWVDETPRISAAATP